MGCEAGCALGVEVDVDGDVDVMGEVDVLVLVGVDVDVGKVVAGTRAAAGKLRVGLREFGVDWRLEV